MPKRPEDMTDEEYMQYKAQNLPSVWRSTYIRPYGAMPTAPASPDVAPIMIREAVENDSLSSLTDRAPLKRLIEMVAPPRQFKSYERLPEPPASAEEDLPYKVRRSRWWGKGPLEP